MKIYCQLKLHGIETREDFENNFSGFNAILNLDDINFFNYEKGKYIHLDFDCVDGYFNEGIYTVRFKDLAETWDDLNFEDSGIEYEDITTDLLEKSEVENYRLFFNKDDGDVFSDIKLIRIGYMDEYGEIRDLKISDTAINEY